MFTCTRGVHSAIERFNEAVLHGLTPLSCFASKPLPGSGTRCNAIRPCRRPSGRATCPKPFATQTPAPQSPLVRPRRETSSNQGDIMKLFSLTFASHPDLECRHILWKPQPCP
jgi:hypothetical protein